MNGRNIFYLEMKNGENVKCDTCGEMIDTFAFLCIDESTKFINKLRCKKCYDESPKEDEYEGGRYEVLNDDKVVIKNWFPDEDLEISCMDLTEIGKRIKRGK